MIEAVAVDRIALTEPPDVTTANIIQRTLAEAASHLRDLGEIRAADILEAVVSDMVLSLASIP